MTNEDNGDKEIIHYGDDYISSANAKPYTWLRISNWFWVLFGFLWFYLFFNGSWGWFDRGYWNELQRSANTTFPTQNLNDPNSSAKS